MNTHTQSIRSKLGGASRLLAFGLNLLHRAKKIVKTLDSCRGRKLNKINYPLKKMRTNVDCLYYISYSVTNQRTPLHETF